VGYRWLVTAALAAHFGYLAYLLLGGFLTWRWPRAIWPHLAACAWGVAIIVFSLPCPLTWAEDQARRRAGLTPLTQGFVDRYLENVIYPPRYVWLARIAVALVVGGSWLVGYQRWRARRDTVRKNTEAPEPAATV
jgi:Protein of Unknown function (DUF2784)